MSRGNILSTARISLACSAAILLAGCGSGLDAVPLPSPGPSGQNYELTAQFTDALNLPAKAKVRLYGADIGEVTDITAHDFTAQVRMRISARIELPTGSTAELRSATPLGDVFVQLRPGPGTTPLHDGDTISVGDTAAAPTVEELLSSMALLTNGGSIRALADRINGAGRAIGSDGTKLSDLIGHTRTLLDGLSARNDQLDAALQSTRDLTADLSVHRSTIENSLSAGAPALSVLAENTGSLLDLADRVGRISAQLSRFPSLQGTDTTSVAADLNQLSTILNDISTDPNLSLTSFNRLLGIFTKITNSTSAHARLEIAKLALVPWPDKNYPGDPGFHGPDGTDWHQLVGGLRYQWNLLLGRIYGANR
ncbi:MlaD family protein [Arthrobacter sp. SLBN-53]|uniref:MlaD family protein n=1 Tax=Arthrobacter sp. SLBN-53 TaxID=2768412 RepID=UPI00115453B7|nr:MlaD family protein [Arthrobacter sp. SLBN-53]TQK32057.1 virulence factor Mce-like protein [Arthrobacter sp. SLBN-53]